ncbi:hypothetical protein AAVH_43328, partial [Aphelenchoides avenae]
GIRRGQADEGGMRSNGSLEDYPGHRRAWNSGERLQGQLGGNARGVALHQDIDRKGARQCHSRSRIRNAHRNCRLQQADRPPRGLQTRRRHSNRDRCAAVPRTRRARARTRLADSGAVPHRCQWTPRRYRQAALDAFASHIRIGRFVRHIQRDSAL